MRFLPTSDQRAMAEAVRDALAKMCTPETLREAGDAQRDRRVWGALASLGVFGLTSDDELPPVNEGTLRHFHEHLSGRLHFPFTSLCIAELLDGGPGLDMMHLRRLVPFDPADDRGLRAECTRNEQVQ